MRKFFSIFYCFVLVAPFSYGSVLASSQISNTVKIHAEAITNSGRLYVDSTNVTKQDIQKGKFFSHVINQHFGLDYNSYAMCNPLGTCNKQLRSMFILSDNIELCGKNVGKIRSDVEVLALHKYLFECLTIVNDSSLRAKSFRNSMLVIQNVKCTLFDNDKVKIDIKKRIVSSVQSAIKLLNDGENWQRLQAISGALPKNEIAISGTSITYGTLHDDILNINAFVNHNISDDDNEYNLNFMVSKSEPDWSKVTKMLKDVQLHIENLTKLQSIKQEEIMPYDNNMTMQKIASDILTYALNLEKYNYINNNNIDIYCKIVQQCTNPYPDSITRMVTPLSWYSSSSHRMNTIKDQTDANAIMVGFFVYDCDAENHHSIGDLNYLTMYPIYK